MTTSRFWMAEQTKTAASIFTMLPEMKENTQAPKAAITGKLISWIAYCTRRPGSAAVVVQGQCAGCRNGQKVGRYGGECQAVKAEQRF